MTGEATRPAARKNSSSQIIIAGLIVVVLIGVIYWLFATAPVIENQQGRIVSLGNGASVLAASDPATFSQLTTVGTAQLAEWQQAGRVALLPVGTQVLVLAVDAPQSKVRVLSGALTGKEFYVLTTAVGH